VNKTLLAAAFAAGAVIAAPIVGALAQDVNSPAATAKAAGPEAMPAMGGGGMGGGPTMMHRMWMHRAMMRGGDPQAWCIDRLAWRAARLAYIETKLGLTAAQRPLWDRVANVAQTEQQKERQLCQSLPTTATQVTMPDRMDRMEEFLAARLDGLRAAKPALTALYQALTPAQQAILNHPFRAS
jgi:LTXXQ motif family protein